MIDAAIIVAGWAVCGFLAYGMTYAYFQREYPTVACEWRAEDRQTALMAAFLGPIGLVVVGLTRSRHGFMWRDPK